MHAMSFLLCCHIFYAAKQPCQNFKGTNALERAHCASLLQKTCIQAGRCAMIAYEMHEHKSSHADAGRKHHEQ